MRRGFTLIEMLVAVGVLLAVIIATSKVFNTASKVASTGEANAGVLQQTSVLEEQMRRDLERITRDGFLAIQCVEVPNDVNVAAGGPLLDPQLPPSGRLRCDQIVFFSAGTEVSARWAGPGDLVTSGGGQQSRSTMVRYAHGVQVPRLTTEVLSNANLFPPVITRVTAGSGGGSSALVPWTWIGNTDRALEFRFGTSAPTTSPAGGAPPIDPNQPEARQWVLARKTALLADDGGHAVFYPEPREYAVAESLGPSSAPSIFGDLSNGQATPFPAGNAYRRWHWRESRDRNWIMTSANMIPSPILQSGWVDVSSSDLDKVRRQIAPTLRLQDPLDIGNLVGYVQSVSLPWAIGFGGASGAPLGWPSGSGAPPWPSDGSIVGIGNNQQLGSVAEYTSQRDRIMRGCFATPASGTAPSVGVLGWPRSEKVVTDTDRKTELLVSPTLLTNCSSFRIDWTWQPGTGRQTTAEGEVVGAVVGLGSTSGVEMGGIVSGAGGLGWFGLPDVSDQPEVVLAQDALSFPGHSNQHMVQVARSIEGAPGNASSPAVTAPFPGQDRIRVYTAVFGFNQDDAYVVSPDGIEVLRDDYTPWPSQIRVTATIHDPRLVLDRGREVQFVLDVPRRRKD